MDGQKILKNLEEREVEKMKLWRDFVITAPRAAIANPFTMSEFSLILI